MDFWQLWSTGWWFLMEQRRGSGLRTSQQSSSAGRAAFESNYGLSAQPFERDSPARNGKAWFSSYWMPNVVLILLPVATKFPSHLLGLHSISLLLGVIEKSPRERERDRKTHKLPKKILTLWMGDFFFSFLASIHIDSAFSYTVQVNSQHGLTGLSNTAARCSQIRAITCWLNRKKDPMSRK